MPSNEQIVEYVKNKIRQEVEAWMNESVDLILFPFRTDERARVGFGKTKSLKDYYEVSSSEFHSITETQIIATAMPSRHKRATVVDLTEVKVDSEYDAGFADGRASLRPLNRDDLEKVLHIQGGMAKARALQISSSIAEHFVAPQPKLERITITMEQARDIHYRYLVNVSPDKYEDLKEAIEHVLNEDQD